MAVAFLAWLRVRWGLPGGGGFGFRCLPGGGFPATTRSIDGTHKMDTDDLTEEVGDGDLDLPLRSKGVGELKSRGFASFGVAERGLLGSGSESDVTG